jgi:hypothetical protein
MFVKLADGFLRVFLRTHLDESKPAGPAGGHVAHDAYAVDLPSAAEQLAELIFRR